MAFPFLSFLQLSDSSAVVLSWLTNLITAGGLINFIIMGVTYIAFYRACKAQGVDRKSLPYTGWFQPWGTWVAVIFEVVVVLVYGYSVFLPGNWSVSSFLTYYTMAFVAPLLFTFWKLFKKTKWVPAHEVDLAWDALLIDAYEASFTEAPETFWGEMLGFIGVRRKKTLQQSEG
jgi:amino acid transporter